MIGHRAKRQKTNGMFFQGLDQDTLKSFVIAVFLKSASARRPDSRMINVTTRSGGLAGHASMVAGTHRIVNKTVRVPFVLPQSAATPWSLLQRSGETCRSPACHLQPQKRNPSLPGLLRFGNRPPLWPLHDAQDREGLPVVFEMGPITLPALAKTPYRDGQLRAPPRGCGPGMEQGPQCPHLLTPTSGSWLNRIESQFTALKKFALQPIVTGHLKTVHLWAPQNRPRFLPYFDAFLPPFLVFRNPAEVFSSRWAPGLF